MFSASLSSFPHPPSCCSLSGSTRPRADAFKGAGRRRKTDGPGCQCGTSRVSVQLKTHSWRRGNIPKGGKWPSCQTCPERGRNPWKTLALPQRQQRRPQQRGGELKMSSSTWESWKASLTPAWEVPGEDGTFCLAALTAGKAGAAGSHSQSFCAKDASLPWTTARGNRGLS